MYHLVQILTAGSKFVNRESGESEKFVFVRYRRGRGRVWAALGLFDGVYRRSEVVAECGAHDVAAHGMSTRADALRLTRCAPPLVFQECESLSLL